MLPTSIAHVLNEAMLCRELSPGFSPFLSSPSVLEQRCTPSHVHTASVTVGVNPPLLAQPTPVPL